MRVLKALMLLLALCCCAPLSAQDIKAGSLDELLTRVRELQSAESTINRQREQRFLAEKHSQKQRLEETEDQCDEQGRDADRLGHADVAVRVDVRIDVGVAIAGGVIVGIYLGFKRLLPNRAATH